jgi:3D (Asp-Asp-Asp) domain-containing protein
MDALPRPKRPAAVAAPALPLMKANRHVILMLVALALLVAAVPSHRTSDLPVQKIVSASLAAPEPVASPPVVLPPPAPPETAPEPAAHKDEVPVLATAYSSGAACNGAWSGRNAVGGRLKSGKVNSAAADWSRFPLGTKFRVVETGKVYVVDDYGSAMVGKDKVDLFMADYGQVRRWGKRNVTLEIIEWGCPERSLEVLKPRSKAPYIRQMVRDLRHRVEDQG